jgi:putative phage-type endonuclease
MEQGSTEWFEARRGKVTSSRVADVISKTKSEWGAGRKNYEAQLIAEILTGQVAESFSSAAMQHGTDTEPQARKAYEFSKDVDVVEVGFVDHPTIGKAGASPDGLVGDVGMVEIKCPNTATHLDTLLSQVVPKKYNTQMQWQMACCGRQWTDFVSFDPRLPVNLNMFCQRVERDDELIASLEKDVSDFINEMSDKIKELESL